jgi:hypothetical protein
MPNSQVSASAVQADEFSMMIDRLTDFILDRIPIGYQDENGFHYGTRLISSLLGQP